MGGGTGRRVGLSLEDPRLPTGKALLSDGHTPPCWGALPALCVGNGSLVLCFSGRLGEKQVPSSTSDDRVKDEFSDLSEG